MKLPDHQEHLEIATRTVPVFRAAKRVHVDVCRRFGSSRKVAKKAAQFARAADALQSELDAEYHAVTSDTQFDECRHAYYPGERLADHEDADVAALELGDLRGALTTLISFATSASAAEKSAFLEKHAARLGPLMLFGMVADGILSELGYVPPGTAVIDAALKKFHEENDNAVE